MESQAKRVMLIGKTGSGKTVKARNLCQSAQRILYYDSNGGDYGDGVICDGLPELKRYWPRVVDGKFSLIFRSGQPVDDFPAVCEMVKACGAMTFNVDECDMYFKKGEPPAEFIDIIRRGRREDIELIGITQRPRAMGELRSMVREMYIFETTEVMDLRWMKEAFGPELVDAVKSLRRFEFVKVELPYDSYNLQICKETRSGSGWRTQVRQREGAGRPAGRVDPQGPPDRGDAADTDIEADAGPTDDDLVQSA